MKIIRTDQVQWQSAMNRGPFQSRRKQIGGEKLTAGLWELAPGKLSFPMHTHSITEEAMYVISGTGVVRTSEGEPQIAAGDYVSFPPGGPAHQVQADAAAPLVFLAMSAVQGFDLVEYPNSKKVACSLGTGPNAKRFVFREADQADYFEGEE